MVSPAGAFYRDAPRLDEIEVRTTEVAPVQKRPRYAKSFYFGERPNIVRSTAVDRPDESVSEWNSAIDFQLGTDARVPSLSIELSGTVGAVSTVEMLRRANVGHVVLLADLAKPKRQSYAFEPHFRQNTVKKVTALFVQLEQSIGQPEAATTMMETRAFLTDSYKKSAISPDTRNFASAISLLQNFLRPHWSEISQEKLRGVNEIFSRLSSSSDVTPRTLRRLYSDLTAVLGSKIRLSTEMADDEAFEEDVTEEAV
jgi:hypothetical protein